MTDKTKQEVDLGKTALNCTHPRGVVDCPIHSKDPAAPLMDCHYGKKMLYNPQTNTMEIDHER